MQRQDFSYEYICNSLKGSNLRVVTIPLCGDLYSHIIYDHKLKDVLYILMKIYGLNLFGEKDIMDYYCDKDSLNFILNSETNVPAIASVNAETFDLEVDISLTDLSSSKYFSVFHDILLFIGECLIELDTKKIEIHNEIKKIDDMYSRIVDSPYQILELKNIYQEKLKATTFYKFKEKRKWKEACDSFYKSRNKIDLIKNELVNLVLKKKGYLTLQKYCDEEQECLLNCKEYLCQYIANLHTLKGKLSCIDKNIMEKKYEQ